MENKAVCCCVILYHFHFPYVSRGRLISFKLFSFVNLWFFFNMRHATCYMLLLTCYASCNMLLLTYYAACYMLLLTCYASRNMLLLTVCLVSCVFLCPVDWRSNSSKCRYFDKIKIYEMNVVCCVGKCSDTNRNIKRLLYCRHGK